MGKHSADVAEWHEVPAPGEALIPPTAAPIIRATPAHHGCWIDANNHGRYTGAQIVRVAAARGWPITTEDQATIDRYTAGNETDVDAVSMPDIEEDAITWLTDNVAPDGYTFGLDEEGSLMLWSDAQWCDSTPGEPCWCVEPHRQAS